MVPGWNRWWHRRNRSATTTTTLSMFQTPTDRLWAIVWGTVLVYGNALLIGKQNLRQTQRHWFGSNHHRDPPDYQLTPLTNPHHRAHGQAMAFSQEQAARAIDYLRNTTTYAKKTNGPKRQTPYFDVLLTREYLQDTHQQVLLAEPVLSQHIGAFSSFQDKNQGDFEFLGQNEGFIY